MSDLAAANCGCGEERCGCGCENQWAVDATQETESLAATPAAVFFGSSFLCVSAEIITTMAAECGNGGDCCWIHR